MKGVLSAKAGFPEPRRMLAESQRIRMDVQGRGAPGIPKFGQIWGSGRGRAQPAAGLGGNVRIVGAGWQSGDNSAHSRLWLWPHPWALLMQLRREGVCWDHCADEHRVFPLLLANIVIMYINTKGQNVSQLNGSLVPAPTAR